MRWKRERKNLRAIEREEAMKKKVRKRKREMTEGRESQSSITQN